MKDQNKEYTKELENRLSSSGVRPTAVRLLIMKYLDSLSHPVSSLDIEKALQTVDRSTISRSISVFVEHHILHPIDDGSGSLKYEICRCNDEHSIQNMHVHFRCIKCGETVCLHSTIIPKVDLPEGFEALGANYVITGLCDKCS